MNFTNGELQVDADPHITDEAAAFHSAFVAMTMTGLKPGFTMRLSSEECAVIIKAFMKMQEQNAELKDRLSQISRLAGG